MIDQKKLRLPAFCDEIKLQPIHMTKHKVARVQKTKTKM